VLKIKEGLRRKFYLENSPQAQLISAAGNIEQRPDTPY